MKNYFLFIVCLLHTGLIFSQIDFIEDNSKLFYNAKSTIPVIICDFNGDMADDLVQISSGSSIVINYQNSNDHVFSFDNSIAPLGTVNWTSVAGDFNNDGLNEFVLAGYYNSARIYGKNNSNDLFELKQTTVPNFFGQNANTIDMNGDGNLDLFICDDDSESEVFLNNGTGVLIFDSDFLDMATIPESDNSGNYGSIWSDFDSDGDIDLYISKCKAGANLPTDPRRINQLFVNNGEYIFEEKAHSFGLAQGAQSWATNFGDIDNDGDLDCFVINHDAPFNLYENIENDTFIDIASNAGVDKLSFSLQTVMRDFDNDGFLDILVGGDPAFLFHNNGDKTFTKLNIELTGENFKGFAVGDLNSDGFIDIYSYYSSSFTQSGFLNDKMWYNSANDNHFVVFSLRGTESNASGIGARLELYGEWGIMIREIFAGESYGISNSFNQHFGLGAATEIDSLVVRWPSGNIDRFFDFQPNNFYQITEQNCMRIVEAISASGPTEFCEGDSVVLSAPSGSSFLWSTGDTTQSISVIVDGDYWLTVYDDTACPMTPIAVNVEVDEESKHPEVFILNGNEINCHGDTIILSTDPADQYSWNTGDTTINIFVSETDLYFVTVPGDCNQVSSEELFIEFYQVENPIVKNDTIYSPGSAILESSGEEVYWYEEENGGDWLHTGNVFEIPDLTETTSFYVEVLELANDTIDFVGEIIHEGPNEYASENFNGGLQFNVFKPLLLHSVTAFTDFEGIRKILILQNDTLIFEKEVFLSKEDSIIYLNVDLLPANDYLITTDIDVNQSSLGSNGPQLKRTYDFFTSYPYSSEQDWLEITIGDFGQEHYYYFYDWVLNREPVFCSSDRVEVQAVLEVSSTEDITDTHFKVFPNPFKDQIRIEMIDINGAIEGRVYNNPGSIIYRFSSDQNGVVVDTKSWPDGIYVLECQIGNEVFYRKLIK